MIRWEGESYQSVREKNVAWELVQMEWCGIVEWMKRNMVCGHMEREKSEDFVKKVFVSETEGPRRR